MSEFNEKLLKLDGLLTEYKLADMKEKYPDIFDTMMRLLEQKQSKLDYAVKALELIADYNTLGGDKYVNYEQGWHGVARFARLALEEIKNDT